LKKLAILLCLIWIGVIFYNSSADGIVSNERSMILLNKVRSIYHKAETNFAGKSKSTTQVTSLASTNKNTKIQSSHLQNLNLIIRKNAHAFEYIVLAILLCNVFFINKTKGKGVIIYVLFICLFYAVTDEFHQLFVPGRASLMSDVLIDFVGALIGTGLYYLMYYKIYLKYGKNYINKRRSKPLF
jgi:VanZ family protein